MSDEQWYWDLKRGAAVPASERGRADDLLGPYPSKEAAEHWKEQVDQRNEAWEEADREWEGDEDDREGGGEA
jgi:hypothetical protein